MTLFVLVRLFVLVSTLCFQTFLFPPSTTLMFEVGINLLQEVNGVIDKQGQPGQAEKDPGSHEEAVPLWVDFVWVIICEGIKENFSLLRIQC